MPASVLKVIEGNVFVFTSGTWAVVTCSECGALALAITYEKNGVTFYTSGSTSSGAIYVNADLYTTTDVISNIALV